jgi:hypothetical protein
LVNFREKPKSQKPLKMKLVLVQASIADQKEWDESDWCNTNNLRELFFGNKDEVVMENIEMMEGDNLLQVLKEKVLEPLNADRLNEKLPEIVLSGESLSFLSLPSKWKNLKYILHIANVSTSVALMWRHWQCAEPIKEDLLY